MRNARFGVFALLAIGLVAACPSSSLGQDGASEAEKAAAEAVAARERAVKAAEEALVAEQKAQRAKRRELERDLSAQEDALDAARAAGDKAATAAAEAEIRVISGKLAALYGFGGRAARKPVAPRAPFRPDEGLPADAARPGATDSVPSALDWLARHQSPGGSWDCDGFEAQCADGKCPGPGGPLFDPGVSALATLAFLGSGETHLTPRHGPVVRNALKYLKGIQDAEGCFGPRTSNHFTYNHAMAALAMAEAYGLTNSPLFRESAQKGADFAQMCRNPYLAWRYGVKPQDNDTSVTGWMVMALKSARVAGLDVDDAAFEGALAWLEKVTEPEYGRAGYTARGNGPARPQELMDAFPSDRSESMTAEAAVTRFHCGQTTGDAILRKGIDLVGRTPPAWDRDAGTIDFYYWYFGTLATFQAGGDDWKRWSGALDTALRPHQRGADSGCARGSWDPVDPWGAEGGRVYSTAVNALSLEVCDRYAKVEGR